MRLGLLPHAEKIAKEIVAEYGNNPEYLTVVEVTEGYLMEKCLTLMPDDRNDLVDYVDYLVSKSSVEVKLPKERL